MHFLCLARCQLGFLLRQFELFGLSAEQQNDILRKEVALVSGQSIDIHAGISGSRMFRLLCEALEDPDPLKSARESQNAQMLELLPAVRGKFHGASGPVYDDSRQLSRRSHHC